MFGNLLGTKTPAYQGTGQPHAASSAGLFGFLQGWFPKAPVYARPQPCAVPPPESSSDDTKGNTASKPVHNEPESPPPDEDQPSPATGKGITIIVTPGPGTTVADVAAFFKERCGLDD